MKDRLDYFKVDASAMKGLLEMEKYVHESDLDPKIFELVKFRASQINNCAYCIDMHSKDARADGESEQRLYVLSAWREAPFFYTEKERAALEWTEALTLLPQGEVEDELYERVLQLFGEKEMLALTITIIAINGWNRLAVPFKSKAGEYQPQKR